MTQQDGVIRQNLVPIMIAVATAVVSITSTVVISQQSTSDNTRRIVNLEKYTRETDKRVDLHDKDIAVLQEQQLTNAETNRGINDLLSKNMEVVNKLQLSVERLAAQIEK